MLNLIKKNLWYEARHLCDTCFSVHVKSFCKLYRCLDDEEQVSITPHEGRPDLNVTAPLEQTVETDKSVSTSARVGSYPGNLTSTPFWHRS